MSIQTTPKGWTVRWREGGRHRSRLFSKARYTRKDAVSFERQQMARLESQRWGVDLPKDTPTLEEFAAQWFSDRIGQLEESTLKQYAWEWETHVHPYLGGYRLGEISPRMVAQWQRDRLSAGAGPRVLTCAGSRLRQVLDEAVREGYVELNAASVLRPAKGSRKPIHPLSPEKVEKIRNQFLAMDRLGDATLVSLMAYAGLRPQEALALRWPQIEDTHILIDRKNVDGEILPRTKTGKPRRVRLVAPLREDLATWRRERAALSPLLFPRASDGKPWKKTDFNNWRRRYFSKLAGCHPYVLRHSFASLLVWEKKPWTYIASQCGHSVLTCERNYAHIMEGVDEGVPMEELIYAARGEAKERRAV